MDRAKVIELGYLGIGASSLENWRKYASEILGLEVSDTEDPMKLRLDYWHNRILVFPDRSDDLLFAGLRVAGPDEFVLMQRQLKEAGVPFEVADEAQAVKRNVLEYLSLRDPSGVPLEIFHGPRVDRHKPFNSGRGMHGRFVTGASGLGHIIIRSTDPDRSYRFYSDVMGMRGSIELRVELLGSAVKPVFMHCNGRDHTIAFGVPTKKCLNHLMLELDNINDVGLTLDLARSKGVRIWMELGRHGNDESISFYMETPSGWLIEVAYGGTPAKHESEYIVEEIWGHKINYRQSI